LTTLFPTAQFSCNPELKPLTDREDFYLLPTSLSNFTVNFSNDMIEENTMPLSGMLKFLQNGSYAKRFLS
jgi:hypothetical protein